MDNTFKRETYHETQYFRYVTLDGRLLYQPLITRVTVTEIDLEKDDDIEKNEKVIASSKDTNQILQYLSTEYTAGLKYPFVTRKYLTLENPSLFTVDKKDNSYKTYVMDSKFYDVSFVTYGKDGIKPVLAAPIIKKVEQHSEYIKVIPQQEEVILATSDKDGQKYFSKSIVETTKTLKTYSL